MVRIRGGWLGKGEVGSGGGWAAGGWLKPPLGPFGLAMSPRSVSHRFKHVQEGLRDASLPQS